MKNKLLSVAVLIGCLSAQKIVAQVQPAQTQTMYVEADGVRANRYGNLDTEGSTFLTEDWITGTATSNKGETYQLNLKYDVIRDQPVFAGKDNGIMIFTVPITKFNLGSYYFQNGFPAVDTWKESTYYKTLGRGKNKLLAHYYKKKLEVRDTGGLTGYKYEDNIDWYVLKDGQMIRVKPSKSAIIGALADKKDQVEAFAKTNKIDFKKDEDLGKLMDYYSSL